MALFKFVSEVISLFAPLAALPDPLAVTLTQLPLSNASNFERFVL